MGDRSGGLCRQTVGAVRQLSSAPVVTLLTFANRFPPYLVRLSARKGRGHKTLTCREIARASGLSKSLVAEISVQNSWDGLLNHCDDFCRGCGVDLFSAKSKRWLKRRPKMNFLFTDRRRQKFHARLLSLSN